MVAPNNVPSEDIAGETFTTTSTPRSSSASYETTAESSTDVGPDSTSSVESPHRSTEGPRHQTLVRSRREVNIHVSGTAEDL